MTGTKRVTPTKVVKYVILLLFAAVAIYPFLWMICASMKSDSQILMYPSRLFMENMNLDAYQTVWKRIPMAMFYKNSILFAGSVTLGTLFFSSLAGYAYAKLNFKGKNLLFIITLTAMMIPFQVTMIPLFVELNFMKLLDTMGALILPRLCGAFEVFMMRNFFLTLPDELQEAARIDGCSEFRIYWNIMLPLCQAAFLSCGLFVFNANWNDLLYPMLLTSSDDLRTLQCGIALLVGKDLKEYSIMASASVLSVLPILVIYISMQKFFIKGITMTGLKG